MKVSEIPQANPEESYRHSLFTKSANNFMSSPEESSDIKPEIEIEKPAKLGIEKLQEFTIFPKQVIDGKTIITA